VKKTVIYKRGYEYKIKVVETRSRKTEDRYLDPENEKIKEYLMKNSLNIGEEKIHLGSKFLWFEKESLYNINVFNSSQIMGGKSYTQNVMIQSMPPSEIPKTLEQKLIKEGFKKSK